MSITVRRLVISVFVFVIPFLQDVAADPRFRTAVGDEQIRNATEFSIEFGAVAIGTQTSRTFSLQGDAAETVDVSLYTVPPFSVNPPTATIPAGTLLGVTVGFAPTALGTLNELLMIEVSRDGRSLRTLTVALSGTGTGTPKSLRILTERLDDLDPCFNGCSDPEISGFQQYTQRLVAEGGELPYTWRFGLPLPPSFFTISNDGLLVIRERGENGPDEVEFNVIVMDRRGFASRTYRVRYSSSGQNQIVILTDDDDLPRGLVGRDFTATLTATGSEDTPYRWTLGLGSDFPDGLDFQQDGRLTGKPQRAGSFGFLATATDEVDQFKSKVLTINVGESRLNQIESGGTIGRVAAGVSGGDGPWSTEFQILNLDDAQPQNYVLRFFNSQGNPMTLPLIENGVASTSDSISGALPARGSRFVETSTTGNLADQTGYAVLETAAPDAIAVNGVITNFFGGDPNRSSRASVPGLSRQQTSARFPFRQTPSFNTCLAITSAATQTVSVEARRNDGGSCNGTFSMQANQHQAFCLRGSALACAEGQNGRLEVSAPSGMAVVSLIFDQQGRFYTQLPISGTP